MAATAVQKSPVTPWLCVFARCSIQGRQWPARHLATAQRVRRRAKITCKQQQRRFRKFTEVDFTEPARHLKLSCSANNEPVYPGQHLELAGKYRFNSSDLKCVFYVRSLPLSLILHTVPHIAHPRLQVGAGKVSVFSVPVRVGSNSRCAKGSRNVSRLGEEGPGTSLPIIAVSKVV